MPSAQLVDNLIRKSVQDGGVGSIQPKMTCEWHSEKHLIHKQSMNRQVHKTNAHWVARGRPFPRRRHAGTDEILFISQWSTLSNIINAIKSPTKTTSNVVWVERKSVTLAWRQIPAPSCEKIGGLTPSSFSSPQHQGGRVQRVHPAGGGRAADAEQLERAGLQPGARWEKDPPSASGAASSQMCTWIYKRKQCLLLKVAKVSLLVTK